MLVSPGFEGIFRKTCEVTMRVMRDEREALMSILRPFIHDPLVEWSRGARNHAAAGELNNEKVSPTEGFFDPSWLSGHTRMFDQRARKTLLKNSFPCRPRRT